MLCELKIQSLNHCAEIAKFLTLEGYSVSVEVRKNEPHIIVVEDKKSEGERRKDG